MVCSLLTYGLWQFFFGSSVVGGGGCVSQHQVYIQISKFVPTFVTHSVLATFLYVGDRGPERPCTKVASQALTLSHHDCERLLGKNRRRMWSSDEICATFMG